MKDFAHKSYKESGIDWCPRIPKQWESTKTKYATGFTTGWTPPTGDDEAYNGTNCWANISDLGPKVLENTAKTISDSAAAATRIKPSPQGSLMFSFKLSIGQVSLAGREMYTNEAIATFLGSDKLAIPFAYYAFPVFLVQNAAENIYGAKLLNQELMRAARFPLPSLVEQLTIASFLDRETTKIDALIAEQKHLIELLQEKRQAVISHAVTKGLNPNAPMKDSGVEWLGQIPITWESPSLGVLISKAELGENFDSSESNEGLPVMKMGNLGRGFVRLDKVERLTDGAEVGDTSLLRDGDFLFNTRNSLDLVGKVALWRSELPMATYNSNILRINFNAHKVASSGYMNHLFNSSFGVSQLRTLAKGTTSVAAIYYKDLTSFRVLLPTLEEQHAISKYLDNACAKIKELIAKARLAVDLLQERRSALISAAVTGQIDVRGLTEEIAA